MRQKSSTPETPSERLVRDIRRATRKQYLAEEKIRRTRCPKASRRVLKKTLATSWWQTAPHGESMSRDDGERRRKMVSLGDDLLRAVGIYCRDSGATLDDVCDEALRDYLKKKGQPVTLHEALKQSAKMIAANDRADKSKKRSRRK